MNKRAEDNTNKEITNVVLVSFVLVFLMYFFTNIANIGQPNPSKGFTELMDQLGKVKKGEELQRVISIRGMQVYGFDYGAKYVKLDDRKVVEKPDAPSCLSDACICFCSGECNEEEVICRRLDGVSSIRATSTFGGDNKGVVDGSTPNYFLALSGEKAKSECVSAKIADNTLYFSDCANPGALTP